MDIKITKPKTEDLPYIKEKIKKYLLDDNNIDWAQFFIARIKEKIVSFGRIIDHGQFFEIATLGVDYYHRKKGIGKTMLSFLVQEARNRNSAKPIYGITHVDGFLNRCGFVRVKENYPAYFDYKLKHNFHIDKTKISVMKWTDTQVKG